MLLRPSAVGDIGATRPSIRLYSKRTYESSTRTLLDPCTLRCAKCSMCRILSTVSVEADVYNHGIEVAQAKRLLPQQIIASYCTKHFATVCERVSVACTAYHDNYEST